MADATTAFLQSLFDTRQSSQISGDPALNAFSSTLSDNNLFKMAAAPVLGAKFDNSTWSPATTFGVSAGQAFLGAALQGLGQNWEAEQMNKATAILPQLYENPASVALPEGMASGAFEKMRLAAERQKIIRDAEQQSAIQRLFGELQMKKFEKALDLEMDPKIKGAEKKAELEALGVDNPDLPANKAAKERQGLEKEFYDRIVKLPQYAQFSDIETNFNALTDLAKQDSKAADIGLISTIARIRDPQSTVREGEFNINADTQSWLNKVAGNWESVVTGKSRLKGIDKARLISSVVPKYNETGASYAKEREKLLTALKLQGGVPANIPTKEYVPADLGAILLQGAGSDLKSFAEMAKEAGLTKEQAKAAWLARGK